MERNTKLAIVVFVILISTLLLIVILRLPPPPSEWSPNLENFRLGNHTIVENETNWTIYVPISYNHTCYLDQESHGCTFVRFVLRIEFTEGEDDVWIDDFYLMEDPPQGYQHTVTRILQYEDREPVGVHLQDVLCP